MKKFIPTISPGIRATVRGYLYSDSDKASLGQDMLEVSFSSGLLIAAGWVPEGSRDGAYEVTVTSGLDLIEPVYLTNSFADAQSYIQGAVLRIGFNRHLPISTSIASNLYPESQVTV